MHVFRSVSLNRIAKISHESRAALRVAGVYGAVATTWIIFSDALLTSRVPSHIAAEVNSIKGICFVVVTSVLLFGLIRRSFSRESALRNSRAESQHRWRELVEHTTDAIIVLDGRRIVNANDVAAKLIGATVSDELIGRDIDAFLITGDLTRVERRIGRLAGGCEMPSRPFRIRRLDGSERTIEAHSTSIKFYDHPVVLSILVDVTERLEQKASLARAKEEAEELARMKTTILNNMSHEIRTPLTGILGISEVLADEVTGEAHSLAELLQDSAWRLMRTLESILTLAQLESDALEFSPEPMDLVDACSRVLRIFEPTAQEKNIRLELEAPTEAVVGSVDPAAFDQVLMNLLSNAIKFTHQGGVKVKLSVDGSCANVEVEDTGIGISESFIPKVFDEYRQESQGITRDFEGTGLGMTIVRRLVDRMGGDIVITSEKGIGTTVRAMLPISSETVRGKWLSVKADR